MSNKLCPGCQTIQPHTNFGWHCKSERRRKRLCFLCARNENKKHYEQNKARYYENVSKRMVELRRKALQYLSQHPCVDCGEKDVVVLDFDHVRGEKEAGGVSKMLNHGCSWENINKEIQKCEVRCANCHRRKTAKEFGWEKYRECQKLTTTCKVVLAIEPVVH